ncbi:hypothetical protein KP79_PYT25715 [Mizuhopecten yessoensis]|uniref:Uncharacterized protein n=1 Tax=Mizuhopecten yessoensis TaxID=6573 RepID=A0A210QMB8_MIZYE|nr:hypothetical protein KP79_PYT25715 [Mizuhopecten yessoensis]
MNNLYVLQIDTAFLGCEDFLMGDIRVDGERHITFGTPTQQELLRRAKRWYLDGTFKVVRRPFVSLYSLHAFIQQEDSMKQVPLIYILMSSMRKIDYLAQCGPQ